MDRPRTAKKYAEAESRLKNELRKKRGSILDKYKLTIDGWLKEAPFNTVSPRQPKSHKIKKNRDE